MIFLFLLPLYIAVAGSILMRFFYWLRHCNHHFNWKSFKIPFTVLYLILALTPLEAFFLPKSAFAIVIRRISTYWTGIMLYTLLFIAIFDLVRVIVKHTKLKETALFSRKSVISFGTVIVACATATCIYGFFQFITKTLCNIIRTKIKALHYKIRRAC